MNPSGRLRRLRIVTIVLLIVIGLNALFAGYSFISEPSGRGIGLTTEYLRHSPFSDYMVPGVVLFIFIGLSSTITTYFIIRKHWIFPFLVFAQGLLLSGWIIIQVFMVKDFNLLHLVCLLSGLFLGVSGFRLIIAQAEEEFKIKSEEEIAHMPKEVFGNEVINEDMLMHLPVIIQKWLISSGATGKPFISIAVLKQEGTMRTGIKGRWMQVRSEQHFTIREPAFIWFADVKAAPLIHLAARDKYQSGKGHMLIKMLSMFTVADARGTQTDQGTMLRFLAETMWFPSAALSNYISWRELSSSSAEATINYGGITATGKFSFNETGDIVSFDAMRYYDRKSGPTLEKWLITVDQKSFKTFNGIRIPAKSAVTWQLKEGDFTWYNLEVTEAWYVWGDAKAPKIDSGSFAGNFKS